MYIILKKKKPQEESRTRQLYKDLEMVVIQIKLVLKQLKTVIIYTSYLSTTNEVDRPDAKEVKT